jgi:hypothetical protein
MKMIVPLPAACPAGTMAPHAAHCCETRRNPPSGRMVLTFPRVTGVPEMLITSTPTCRSRPCWTEHSPPFWASPESPATLRLEE